ncbi:MAG: DNA repair protein RecN [Prevotella sp.]|nr:DNA repair protein RecN [Prevotella sp.]
MLRRLYIKNFTLIDELDIEFQKGFSVITGETGAGKSIILGAIGLLLGQRADSKNVKAGTGKCVIEAHFDLTRSDVKSFFDQNDIEYDEHDTIVRRELMISGKSRAFINDMPVQLSQLKELGDRLVDVHSQHQNLLLSKHDFQMEVVDILAADARQLAAYREAFAVFNATLREKENLLAEMEQNRRNADFLQFQCDELSAAHLTDGEQEELEQRSATMTHAEEIKSSLYEASMALEGEDNGMLSALKRAAQALQGVAHVFPDAEQLARRIDSSYIELKDVASELSSSMDEIDFDPAELESINERLDRLYSLQKKYQVESVASLQAICNDLKVRLDRIDNSEEALRELDARLKEQQVVCRDKALHISEKRRQAAAKIEKEMKSRLALLGMPRVRFEVRIEPTELTQVGADRVSFLFSANTSSPLQPVAHVASGGEIARVMLSLKAMISGAVSLPTIIFDEIDTGVSGKMAEQMARIMCEMGVGERQVISITHLPQIAAKGTAHYKVYKEESPQGTTSRMQLLSADERVAEIAQMLSGSSVTEAAVANARQLLGV